MASRRIYADEEEQAGPIKLTRCETEILLLTFRGHTAQQIADQRYVNIRTVVFHLGNVYIKLGASNRMQCLRRVLQTQAIPTECVMETLLA